MIDSSSTSRRDTAGALLFDGTGRVLLGLRAAHKTDAPGCWDIIGGRVEAGESVEQALVRELEEEVAITATTFRLLESIKDPADGGPTHHVFAVTSWRGSPTNASDEHDEIRWFQLDEIESLDNRTPFDFDTLFAQAAQRR